MEYELEKIEYSKDVLSINWVMILKQHGVTILKLVARKM